MRPSTPANPLILWITCPTSLPRAWITENAAHKLIILYLPNKGLVIIGVPSNDFGNQESGDNEDIKEFCESSFGISFPLTEKYTVKGNNAHPFFQWTKKELGFISGVPRWNFHKILIDKQGNAVAGFTALTKPSSTEFQKELSRIISE